MHTVHAFIMPLCQGLPSGPCPARRNDNAVRLGEGDLMLCKSCDKARFDLFLDTKESRDLTKLDSEVRDAVNVDNDGHVADTATTTCVNVAGSASASTSDTSASSKSIVVNELLSYASFYRDRASVDNLRKLIIHFYAAAEISVAKKTLLRYYSSSLTDCPHKVERRKKSTSRSVHDAETDDILSIMAFLDQRSLLTDVKFVAFDLDRLPKYGPEELNICSIADKQETLNGRLVDLSNRFDALDTRVTNTVDKALQPIQKQLNDLCEVTKSLLTTNSSSKRRTESSNTPTPASIDRSRNVIITGVQENRDHTVWRDTVMNVLSIAAGRDVHVEDALRLGAYNSNKKRPILVKFRSVWDRRLVLSGARKLNNDVLYRRKVFINADEPLEDRRLHTLQRLKRQAESRGQQVDVSSDNVLSVDGIACFSLRDGLLNRQIISNRSSGSVNFSSDGHGLADNSPT